MDNLQIAGDKSGELSVVGNDSVLENDDMLEIASNDDHDIDVDNETDDGDVSYDANDQSTNGYGRSLGPYSDEESVDDGDDIIFTDDFDRRDGEEDNDTVERNNNYQQDLERIMLELIEQYPSTEPVSFQSYKDALTQLNSRWEEVLERAFIDQDDMMRQERRDMTIRLSTEVDNMRREQEDEVENVKREVLEQSQKIIRQEMKSNAERERKAELEMNTRIRQAVNETKEEMNEDFEIALSGMKAAEEDMKKRYEQLVKDTEIRVRDEVQSNAKRDANRKIDVFTDQFEEMKCQVIDLNMELQKAQMNPKLDDILEKKNQEIFHLQRDIDQIKADYELRIGNIHAGHKAELLSLKSEIDEKMSFQEMESKKKSTELKHEYDEKIKTAKDETKRKLIESHETTLTIMKKKEDVLKQQHEQELKDVGSRVREEMSKVMNTEIELSMKKYEAEKEKVSTLQSQTCLMEKQLEDIEATAKAFLVEIERLKSFHEKEVANLQETILNKKEDDIQKQHKQELKDVESHVREEMKTVMNSQVELSMKKYEAEKEKVSTLESQTSKEIEKMKAFHQDEIANLQSTIDEQSKRLTQKEIGLQTHLKAKTALDEKLKIVNQNLRECVAETNVLKAEIDTLKQEKESKIDDVRTEFEDKIAKREEEFETLKASHEQIKLSEGMSPKGNEMSTTSKENVVSRHGSYSPDDKGISNESVPVLTYAQESITPSHMEDADIDSSLSSGSGSESGPSDGGSIEANKGILTSEKKTPNRSHSKKSALQFADLSPLTFGSPGRRSRQLSTTPFPSKNKSMSTPWIVSKLPSETGNPNVRKTPPRPHMNASKRVVIISTPGNKYHTPDKVPSALKRIHARGLVLSSARKRQSFATSPIPTENARLLVLTPMTDKLKKVRWQWVV